MRHITGREKDNVKKDGQILEKISRNVEKGQDRRHMIGYKLDESIVVAVTRWSTLPELHYLC